MQDLPPSLSPYRRGLMVADMAGNLRRVGDSVILNIEDSSSAANSSSSDYEPGVGRMDSYERDFDEEEEDAERQGRSDSDDDDDADVDNDDDEELHCDDWEIRMLAAEMERRENSQVEMSGANLDGNAAASGVRRRRKRSETTTDETTEHSEQEVASASALVAAATAGQQQVHDSAHRPRASSLDQNNPAKRSRGFFKAMSFDRDKDRL